MKIKDTGFPHRGFLTDARFYSAMKIKDTGSTEYFVQDLKSADTLIKERIVRKLHLIDNRHEVGIIHDLKDSDKEPQLNTRQGLRTGWRKFLWPREGPRACITGYVVPSSLPPPLQSTKAPSYHWSFLRLRAAQ